MSSMYGRQPMRQSASEAGQSLRGSGNKIPSGYEMGQIQQFTPEQMQLFQQLFGHVNPGSYTSRLASGDQGLFEEMERPALQQFSGLQGNLASRFSGMGTGARRSSGFQNTSNQYAQDFASQLQSQRQGLQRQAISDLFGMSSNLLGQRPYDTFMTEKKPDFMESIMGSLGGGLASGAGQVGGMAGILKLLSKFGMI